MDKQILDVIKMGAYEIRLEKWRMGEDDDWTEMGAAYSTKDGSYIGNVDDAISLCEDKGILPECIDDSHNTASIGFCQREQKWYGWSHRAIFGFGVGDVVKEEDCTASSGWIDGVDPEGNPDPLVLPVGFHAKSLDDARRMAVAFASSVS